MDAVVFFFSFLPGLAWLFFYLQEDCHPEPKHLLLLVFIAGAASAFVAYFAQVYSIPFLNGAGIANYSPLSLLILAAIEEVSKFGAVWLAIHKNSEFDEPIDAMIYMVVAALGFATLENLGALTNHAPHFDGVGQILQTTSLRFVGATLLHTLSSALVGYYWSMCLRTFNTTRFLVFGLGAATILHAFFNYLILRYDDLSYALLFVVIAGFFILSDFEKLRGKVV